MIITFGQLFGIVRQLLFRSRRDEGASQRHVKQSCRGSYASESYRTLNVCDWKGELNQLMGMQLPTWRAC